MLKCFPLDFIRPAFEQKLFEEHQKNVHYFGGKDQINIFSFYEQLKGQDEVDRFVETYRDLTEQQNRTGLIGNGILVSPENPSITNLYSSLIIPMTYTCSIRCTLADRDQMIITINNLIDKLKGRKVDIAQLKCDDENGKDFYVPFMVGTIGQSDNAPTLKNGDYLGDIATGVNVNTFVTTVISNLTSKGVTVQPDYPNQWYYASYGGKICVIRFYPSQAVWYIASDDGTTPEILFPPTHDSFEKFKMSFSFDAIRCDEPRTLNAEEYCELSFSGSATLVSNGVQLGNDLLKINVSKDSVDAESSITFASNSNYLEPLELPSGSNANTQINQLVSNKFLSGTHTDALAIALQYTFILDRDIPLLDIWFKYARYGTWTIDGNDLSVKVSPNMIYKVYEHWCSWGKYDAFAYKGKIVENIDIENTESDTLTISVSFQIQGVVS